MYKHKKLALLLLPLFVLLNCVQSNQQKKQQKDEVQPLLLISFDGFRYDYLTKTDTPNFDSLIANGVKAESLIPVFPSKTFPNHYSIATGLYPENSGLVGNTMYDPEFDAWYRISDRDAVTDPKWYNGEPIWNTVEKQGLKAGTFFWVGSETPIQGMRPTYWKIYKESVPNTARIDTVVKWLGYNDDRGVDFAALYFSFVDAAGHEYGTDSDSLIAAVQKADRLIGYLKNKLSENHLWNTINIIVLADHGMVNLSADKTIMLPSIINMDNVERIIWSPATMIWPKEGSKENLFNKLKQNEAHYHIYKKENLPEWYHLQNRRVAPLIMVADLGYTILSDEYKDTFLKRLPGAAHGYDNHQKKMQAIFIAHGPAFKKGIVVPSFENVHVYELMTHLLGLKPSPNDGSLDSVKAMLN